MFEYYSFLYFSVIAPDKSTLATNIMELPDSHSFLLTKVGIERGEIEG